MPASEMHPLVHVHRTLAHDLRGPLNSMRLALDLLADTIASPAAGDAGRRPERYLAILQEEITRLDRILRALEQKGPPDATPSS
jgi:signal transduction histidine kinase